MGRAIIYAGRVVTPFTTLRNALIEVRDGIVADVCEGCGSAGSGINYRDYIVIPGILDTHIHGIKGFDVNSGRASDILGMSRSLVEHGVTGFVPSTVTAPHDELVKVCRAVSEAFKEWSTGAPQGARVLGLHLEGPYINPEKKGAQNPEFTREASFREVLEYFKASNGLLRMITLAPEVKGALEIVGRVSALGVVVSLGHSNADYETAVKAVRRGATRATHLFNAMRAVHHRDPGLVVALLEEQAVYIELIADFIHLHPAVVRFAIRHVGVDRVVLVSDSISATGLPDGTYSLGGLKVYVSSGVARLANGSLAGSTLTLDRALANVAKLGFNLNDVVKMLSLNPARSLGLAKLGDVRPGYYGDFTVLNDDLRVKAAIVGGVEVYSSRAG